MSGRDRRASAARPGFPVQDRVRVQVRDQGNGEIRMGKGSDVGVVGDFEHLVPDTMLNAVEQALGEKMTGLATALPSYINRVYEVQTLAGTRLIAKFYRPGRWSREALQDEHDFVADCAADEIPVIAPLTLPGGGTIHEADGIYFTLFPKRYGRQLEINTDDDWLRVGRLMGRVHVTGSRRQAGSRTDLHPARSTAQHIQHLVDDGFVTPRYVRDF